MKDRVWCSPYPFNSPGGERVDLFVPVHPPSWIWLFVEQNNKYTMVRIGLWTSCPSDIMEGNHLAHQILFPLLSLYACKYLSLMVVHQLSIKETTLTKTEPRRNSTVMESLQTPHKTTQETAVPSCHHVGNI